MSQTINGTPVPDSIGRDNGIGDIFFTEVRCDDGTHKTVTVYGRNLQNAGAMITRHFGDRVVKSW